MPIVTGETRASRLVFILLQAISKWHTDFLLPLVHRSTRSHILSALLVQHSLQHTSRQNKVSLNLSPEVTPQTSSEVTSVHLVFDQKKKYVCLGCKQAVMQSMCLLKCGWKMQRLWIRLVETSLTSNARQAQCSWHITMQSCKEGPWLWQAPGWFCSV